MSEKMTAEERARECIIGNCNEYKCRGPVDHRSCGCLQDIAEAIRAAEDAAYERAALVCMEEHEVYMAGNIRALKSKT